MLDEDQDNVIVYHSIYMSIKPGLDSRSYKEQVRVRFVVFCEVQCQVCTLVTELGRLDEEIYLVGTLGFNYIFFLES